MFLVAPFHCPKCDAKNSARTLLAGREDLHPADWNRQFDAIRLVVETEIQNYARQMEAQERRLYPLRNGRGREA
jgi:hypothetical protein